MRFGWGFQQLNSTLFIKGQYFSGFFMSCSNLELDVDEKLPFPGKWLAIRSSKR
jgi:hypothetical protein